MWRHRINKVALYLFLSGCCQAAAAGATDLETVSPEAAGWSSEKLKAAAEYADELGYSAMIMAFNGKVFFAWGEIEKDYWCHSIRKPLLSSLYGIHVGNKTIDLDLTLADLGVDDIPPELSPDEKRATIRQLLQGRSGVYHEAAACAYEYEREKSQHPAYKFRMSARDLARFGILYQNGGVWEGKRIIPENWILESTTTYSVADSALGAGFGYMWGIVLEGGVLSRLLGGTGLFFSGIGVHNLAIVEDLGLVLVLRFDTDGEWTPPPAGSSGKLYTMINTARIRADK